jgi:hypothetical protein
LQLADRQSIQDFASMPLAENFCAQLGASCVVMHAPYKSNAVRQAGSSS